MGAPGADGAYGVVCHAAGFHARDFFGKVSFKDFWDGCFFCSVLQACVAVMFANNMGVVFADDGGWNESGRTLPGSLMNAGFGIILSISLLTIGLWVGASLL